jgi:putative acetyltransferase
MLDHLVAEAGAQGLARLMLETGSQPGFAAARGLYARAGFAVCGPFADYREDPNSVYMTRSLRPADGACDGRGAGPKACPSAP